MKNISRIKSALFVFLYFFSLPLIIAQVEINPQQIDLGEWPIGGWQEASSISLNNSSPDTLIIIASEIENQQGVFEINPIQLPLILPPYTDTSNIDIWFSGDNIPEGVYQTNYLAICEETNDTSFAQIMVSAYIAPEGDIIENPIITSLPYTANNNSTSFPFRSNYKISEFYETGNDIVYKLELDMDQYLNINITNSNSSFALALYDENFSALDGPMNNNTIAYAENDSIDIPVFAGNYYLVLAPLSANSILNYDIEIFGVQLPAPDKAFNPSPADGADSIPDDNTILEWEFSDYTLEYRILFGTEYPLSNVILDWTSDLNNTYHLPDIDPNMNWFWRVDVKNNTAIQIGDVWSFTTIIGPPSNLTATIHTISEFEFDVVLNWTSIGKNFQGYNVYRDDIKLNDEILVGITTYLDENPDPNMDPCYEYWVEGVFSTGVTPPSNTATACIPGPCIIEGDITDSISGEPIEGVIISLLNGQYEYSSCVTDANGHYTDTTINNTCNYQVSKAGYITKIRENIDIELDEITTEDFQLQRFPFSVDSITATIINESTVQLEWDIIDDLDYEILGYNFLRFNCNSLDSAEFVGMIAGESELFLDNGWHNLDIGEYKYSIEIMYNDDISHGLYSNCLEKIIEVTVGVEVHTDNFESPEGASIIFTNTSNPNEEISYEMTLDNSGTTIIQPFITGLYDISIECIGYQEMYFSDVNINSDTTFVWELQHVFESILDLYVTPNGIATWRLGYPEAMDGFFEDFYNGIPNNWEIVNGGNSNDTWTIGESPGIDTSSYARCDSYAAGSGIIMDEYLISPIINAPYAEELFLEWDQNYQNSSGQDYFSVEVFDGIGWFEVYFQNTDDNTWPENIHKIVDISEHANANLQVRFHYVAESWAWHIGIDNVHIHDNSGKSNDNFQFYKVFLDGIFLADCDTAYVDQEDVDYYPILVPGQTYLTEVTPLFSTGLGSQVGYTWTYMPTDDFDNPAILDVSIIEATDDFLIQWSNLNPIELLEINQVYGNQETAYYQELESGYGVVYDLSSYPDAMINAMDFRHSSWGNTGIWQYNIHVIDWDTKTVLETIGPIQTTGNDKWEEQVELGEILSNGASQIAIILEPLGNTSTNAYPRIDTDNANDAQGSVYGDLSDLENMNTSNLGNFLMDLWIQTSNGGKSIKAPKGVPNYYSVGTNLYKNDELLVFVPEPDTFYIEEDVPPGNYDYCVAKVYTADNGLHTWESLNDEVCVNDIICPPDCDPPLNSMGTEYIFNDYILFELSWQEPDSKFTKSQLGFIGYNVYRNDEQINTELVLETYYNDSLVGWTPWDAACWVIKAVYEDCISDPSNVVCKDVIPGFGEIKNTCKVYPNPAKDFLIIESTKNMKSIKITNYMGQVISSTKSVELTKTRIETSKLNAGIYFVEVETEVGIEKVRVIISN